MTTRFRRELAKGSPFFAANQVDSASFVLGTQSGTTLNVGVTLLGPDGVAISQRGAVDLWLSSSPTGIPVASAPSGGAAIGTNGMLITQVTNVAWKAVSNASGLFDITLTDTGGHTFYLVIQTPTGILVISPAIVMT